MNTRRLIRIIIVTAVLFGSVETSSFAKSKITVRKKELKNIEKTAEKDTSLPERPTLNDYISAGLSRSPDLRASFYEWKARFQKITQAFSLPDPQFTYTEYLEEVETRVGPQRRAYEVMQKIPLPDTLWIRKNKAFRASEEAYYGFEKKRLDLIQEITDAYYEYAYLARAIALTDENMKLLQSFESVAQTRYSSGLAKNQDLLKVQVELGKLENDLLSLKDLRKPLVSRLNALLNLPEDYDLPWPDETLESINFNDAYNADTSGLIDRLKNNNPELRSLSEKVEKNKEDLRLSRRDYFPDVAVGVKTIDTGDALNPNMKDSGNDPIMLMVTVNVPVWFWRINAKIEESRSMVRAAQNSHEAKKQELLSKLSLIHYKLRDAVRQADLYKGALIPKARQTLNATNSGYQAGHVDFLSLIDAQRVLLNFQLAYYRHAADIHQRLADLNKLLGIIENIDD